MTREKRITQINERLERAYADGWTCFVQRAGGPEVAIEPLAEAFMDAIGPHPNHLGPVWARVRWERI